nr:Hint domain-containing protein [uncultured Roseovarius sp.]
MGWIGISDHTGGWFNRAGLPEADNLDPSIPLDAIAPRGTLLIETHLSPEGRPQTLLRFDRPQPWSGGLSLQVMPSGGIVLVEAMGNDVRHAALPHDLDRRSDEVRVRYTWDAPRRWGRLSLEHLAAGRIRSRSLQPPHPMPLEDLRMITRYPARREMDPDVSFLAVSDEVEPIGPMPGLTADVPIATPHGPVAAARLRRGDTVLTSTGDIVPVLQTVSQTVPARGSLRPVRLRAPFFGLAHDIVLAPHQRLVIDGSEVEYMFGAEAVLVPARHLVNGVSAFYSDGPDLVTYHHILLPEHAAVIAAGCPVESLYIGRLRRDPVALAESVLHAAPRHRLPEHASPVWPVLRPFEAVTLAKHRAA